MFVYSGKCKLCECGKPTGIYDNTGEHLKTGDIVVIFTYDEGVKYIPNNLTVVIEKQFVSYSDDTHVPIDHPEKPFVMGIKNVDLANSDWGVIRVKEWKDVVHGEHWKAYGFNYREE